MHRPHPSSLPSPIIYPVTTPDGLPFLFLLLLLFRPQIISFSPLHRLRPSPKERSTGNIMHPATRLSAWVRPFLPYHIQNRRGTWTQGWLYLLLFWIILSTVVRSLHRSTSRLVEYSLNSKAQLPKYYYYYSKSSPTKPPSCRRMNK